MKYKAIAIRQQEKLEQKKKVKEEGKQQRYHYKTNNEGIDFNLIIFLIKGNERKTTVIRGRVPHWMKYTHTIT